MLCAASHAKDSRRNRSAARDPLVYSEFVKNRGDLTRLGQDILAGDLLDTAIECTIQNSRSCRSVFARRVKQHPGLDLKRVPVLTTSSAAVKLRPPNSIGSDPTNFAGMGSSSIRKSPSGSRKPHPVLILQNSFMR